MLLLALGCSDYQLSPEMNVTEPTCPLEPPAPYAVDAVECPGEAIVGSFEPIVEWTWTSNPWDSGYEQIMAAPAVGNLTDDNGDGQIDHHDVPDVVFTTFAGSSYGSAGALVAISGDDGHQLWSGVDFGGWSPYASSGVAIADLGDGEPTILVSATAGLLAVDADGVYKWAASVPPSYMGCPSVADVDGDGAAEVVYGPSLVSSDGTVRWVGSGGAGGYMSFAADLDQDGLAEIVAGNTVYGGDGSVRWTDGGPDGFSAIGDLDLDGSPEVVRVGGSVVRASRADGSVLWDFALDDGGGGPPTIADFDGDGYAEVGVASRSVYRVIESDGTERWRQTVQDYSSAVTGSSVFDFEGDGAAEVVYADEQTLWVYDGGSGTIELALDAHSSGTLMEYPLIVDVDRDGAAEIVVASNDYAFAGSHGITVIGDANGSWAPGRAVWNQHAYNIANVDEDGRIPRRAEAAWEHWNSFRAGNSETKLGLMRSNLAIGGVSVCEDECGTRGGLLFVAVENHGSNEALGVDLALVTRRGEKLLDLVRTTIDRVPPGETVWSDGIWVDPDDIGAELTAVLDRDDTIDECSEDDNRLDVASFCD